MTLTYDKNTKSLAIKFNDGVTRTYVMKNDAPPFLDGMLQYLDELDQGGSGGGGGSSTSDVASWATKDSTEPIPADKIQLSVEDLSGSDMIVKYQNFDTNRKTIQLANHDTISGLDTNGTGFNLLMLSKWNKVDIGSSGVQMNLNSVDGTVQINDDKIVATTDQIPTVESIVQNPEFQEIIGKYMTETEADAKYVTQTTSVNGKQLNTDINLSSQDLTDGDEIATKTELQNGYVPSDRTINGKPLTDNIKLTFDDLGGDMSGYVPSSRRVNGHELTENIMLVSTDLGDADTIAYKSELPTDYVKNTTTVAGKTLEGAVTISRSDLSDGNEVATLADIPVMDHYVTDSRTVAGKPLSADITLASTDLTDGGQIMKRSDYPDGILTETQANQKYAQISDMTTKLAFKADLVDGKIPESQLPSYIDDVIEVTSLPASGESGKIYIVTEGEDANKQYRWSGTQFVELTSGSVVIGTVTGTAYDGGKGTELEGKVADLGSGVVGDSLQLGNPEKDLNLNTLVSDDLAPYSNVMINSTDIVATLVPMADPNHPNRRAIQLKNHDALSGVMTTGEGANIAMLSKWDVADFGSIKTHLNLNVKADNGHNGRVTVNDDNEVAYLSDINEVFELNGLTELETGASSESIQTALGVDFETLVNTISENKLVIVDRNSAGDYKACIHATGNISSGNGGANLMFFLGTVPTIFEVQYVSGTFALYVAEYEFAKKSDIPDVANFATTQNVSDAIAAEASARDKAIETATSDLVHNTLTVAGKSLTGNITLESADLTDGANLAKTSDVSELDTKVFGDLDVSKFTENPELTCQVAKLDASYTGDLGLPENINGQPYNAETNPVNQSINYLVLGYFDDGFVFHYDAWDAAHSSAIFSTIISTVGLTNSTVNNRVPKTTKVAGHALNADVTLASTDLTDGANLAKKDEILDTVVDENTNETLRQALTARTHLPFARNSALTGQTEAQIFALFNESITNKNELKNYLQSNMAYIAYNLDSLGEHQYYKLPILLASIPDSGDITVIAIAADIYNSDLITKFTYTIVLNGDSSSVTIEKKVLES